jgi:transposase
MFFLRKRADPLKVSMKMELGNGVGFCMGPRFVNIDHDTPLLLPPNLRDWVPSDHLSHFILDAVDELDLRRVRVNTRGTGSEQYPPSMLLSLLLYSYATGVFSSRRIEQSTVSLRQACRRDTIQLH